MAQAFPLSLFSLPGYDPGMTDAPASQRFAKVTISLPAGLLSAVDKLQRKTGRSRSEVIRDAVEGLLAAEAERADERRWLKAYRQQPQSEAELAWTKSALESLAVNEWDAPAPQPPRPPSRPKRS